MRWNREGNKRKGRTRRDKGNTHLAGGENVCWGYSRSKQHVESEGIPLSVQLRLCDLEYSKGM